MGVNKLLLEMEGDALVRRAVRAAVESGVDRVVVVLGHEEARVRAALDGLPCTMVVNPDHAKGQGTSVRAGVRQVSAEVDAVVFVLADMPRVSATMIRGVVERYQATHAPVVVSQYGDLQPNTPTVAVVQPNTPTVAAVQAPPTLFARALFPELLAIGEAQGAKEVARRHVGEAEVVTWPSAASRDIDVPADYDALRRGRRKD
jgi:molybdenum cofactor cytidylyltransferase